MQKKYSISLHVFRRDLRLQDNSALIEALSSSDSVIPCFIFDKRQIEHNDYKSDNCIQFMVRSLQELDTELSEKESKLYFFYGVAEEVIEQLIRKLNINAIFVNRDYTPFSQARDKKIAALCHEHGVDFHRHADALLHEPEQVLKSDQQPYTVFTPFFHKASQFAIASAHRNTHDNYYRDDISLEDRVILNKLLRKNNPNLLVKGGRREALVLLKNIQNIKDYKNERNIPALAATTRLSAHNKFGTVSIRAVHAAIVKQFGSQHTLITELYWRDFFTHIAYHYPRVIGHAFQEKYAQLQWSRNENHFRAWCEGRTGFPIVDAGMRELNTTGYMHNRVRMIVASFLVKDLQIDWRWGEKYFAQKLVDYDAAVNNGNWQWAASTGCDAQPYFRIFNPWLQQQKFDPECLYIKRWVVELANLPAKIIHDLSKNMTGLMTNYPHPIVDHATASQKAKAMFKFSQS